MTLICLYFSGLYPLFRSGAADLCGAGLHLQLVLQKPSSSHQVRIRLFIVWLLISEFILLNTNTLVDFPTGCQPEKEMWAINEILKF